MKEVPPSRQVLQGNAAFANKIYQILAQKPGNVFFSSISLHVVLAMAYQGARNETAELLAKVLQIPDAQSTAEGYKKIINRLRNIQKVILCMAFKIYVHKGRQFVNEFEKIVKEYFNSEIQALDFDKKARTVKTINNWVAQKTRQKIKEIVSVESIQVTTSLFLVNALYFKADRTSKFSESKTKDEDFYLEDGSIVKVQMMKDMNEDMLYKFDEDLGAQILCLPYSSGRVRMVIVLPKERGGIRNLETKLAATNLTQITSDMQEVKVDLSLPKFKFETTIQFDELVRMMGLGLIFDRDGADFKEILQLRCDENLYVGKILQKAFIDVNEKGSEAAAATVVDMAVEVCFREMKKIIVTFTVDHAAIFMLTEGQGEDTTILFCGRLSHPKYQ